MALCSCTVVPAAAQYTGFIREVTVNDGTDPTRPITRIDLRNDFFADWQEFEDDRSYNVTSVGAGLPFGDRFNVGLDIPVVTTNLTFTTKTGLGDIPLRAEYIADRGSPGRLIAGLLLSFPTAIEDEMGTGKFLIGPGIGAVFSFMGGFWGILLRDVFSVAGHDSRPNIHELWIRPLVKLDLGKQWYTLFTPDIRINWVSERVFLPFTIEFGKLWGNSWLVSVRGGGHISNADKRYDWRTQIRVGYLFQSNVR